jgi:predicted transcriptional regulator
MKSILRIPDEVKLLEPNQVLALSPADRQRYYDRVIMDILRANREGVTVGEIEEVTSFMARTIRPHLKALVARGEAICVNRGKWTIYQANGEIQDKPVAIQSVAKLGTTYVVNKIKDNAGNISYYIQEKELDAYRLLTVKGGITIHSSDMKHFLTEINTIVMRDARGKTE